MEKKVGWVKTELGQICDVVRGASPRPMGDPRYFTGNIPFIKIGDITKINGKTIFNSEIYVNEEGAKKSRLLKKGSLILSNSGTVCIPKFLGIDSCIHDGFVTFNDIPDFVSLNFLFHYFHYIRPYVIQKHKQGVTQVNLNTTIVKEFKISLPPLPEQRAIVSKIEQLFSELDNGISNLKLAQEQLKVYRQAVLNKAFEGELTKKWRERQTNLPDAGDLLEQMRKERGETEKVLGKKTKKKIDEITQYPVIYESENLPNGWCWVKVDSILFDPKKGMTTGPFGTALKKHEHQKNGIPVYGIENIGEGIFRMPNKIFITEEKAKELQAFEVKPYDIIISRSGTVGEICSIPEKITSGIISTNLIRVRLDLDTISTKYFVYLFQGGNVREQVKELCKGSTRAFLNQTILSSINFPLCSLPEQQAIVQEIETRLSVCDKIEQDIETNLERAEALRQSILKKAFEGKLLNERELAGVRKAEDWEPAEVLLERIKAKRAQNGKK